MSDRSGGATGHGLGRDGRYKEPDKLRRLSSFVGEVAERRLSPHRPIGSRRHRKAADHGTDRRPCVGSPDGGARAAPDPGTVGVAPTADQRGQLTMMTVALVHLRLRIIRC